MQDRPPNLLESWKEIAAFLGRDKRTAMRWAESHGMPVHRYPGSKQARVFAYRDQLSAWLASFEHPDIEQVSGIGEETSSQSHGNHFQVEQNLPGAVAAPSSVISVSEQDEWPESPDMAPILHGVSADSSVEIKDRDAKLGRISATLWLRRWSIAAVTTILILVAGVVAFLRPDVKSVAGLKAAGLIQLTDDGRGKRNLRTGGSTLFYDEISGLNGMLSSIPAGGGPARPIPTPFGDSALQDVSRDGKTLLISAGEAIETAGQLWKLPAQGGTPTRIGEVRCYCARWSPDGKQIACINGNNLAVTDADGRDPHLIWTFDSMPANLIWSPDGSKIRLVLADLSTGARSGWEVDWSAAGSPGRTVPKKLSQDSPCCVDWTWLGNSKNFAYVPAKKDADPHPNLSDQRLVLSRWLRPQKELSLNLGQVQELASENDGSRLYFLISNADRGELLRFDTRQTVFQSFLPGLSAQYLSFSRDGQWLSYASTEDDSLWRSKADGTQAIRIAGPPMKAQHSAWSPDGRQIAFMARLSGHHWRIYLVGRDGGTPREAISGDDSQGAPSWSPDGKTIAYGRVNCEHDNSCGIFLLDLETGHVQPLPDSEKLRTARWSPDGRYIAAIEPYSQSVQLFDLRDRRWHKVAENMTGDDISWAKDSRALYLSCLVSDKPTIEKVKISDHSRSTAVDLTPLQRMPGQLRMWFGLAPDDSPIVLHLHTSVEVYALDIGQ
jgi:Tol biopolymer transport system component